MDKSYVIIENNLSEKLEESFINMGVPLTFIKEGTKASLQKHIDSN